MRKKPKGAWIDENTYVEEDGSIHKAMDIGKGRCTYCSLGGNKQACMSSKCNKDERTDGRYVMFSKVQKVEVDKCK